MIMENLRRETGEGTIPAGVAGTGTITFAASGLTGIVGGGATYNSANNDFINGETAGGAENLWLYIPSENEARKIVGANVNTNGTDTNISVVIESAFTNPIAAQAFEVVNGDLRYFSVLNDGGANGEIDGVVFGDSVVPLKRSKSDYPVGNLLDVVTFDASGTSFLIDEQLD